MMGGQFQAEEEEQFHYSSLKSTVSAPKTPEIILDKPIPPKRPPTPPIPHHSPSILKQSLLTNAPDLPLTLLPPTPSPAINIQDLMAHPEHSMQGEYPLPLYLLASLIA